jgi:hypothetical protein
MSVRLNIIIDDQVYRRLKETLPPKRISAFINDVVRSQLFPDRRALDAAYRAASREGWRRGVARDWQPTDAEGWPE